MRGQELITELEQKLGQMVEGVIVRRLVGGQYLYHRVGENEEVNLAEYTEVIALVPLPVASLSERR